MQLETLAFTASTHLAAATTAKTTSSPSPRLPPPPLATKRARQNLGATNRSSANLAVHSPRARKPVERRETDPHARMPYVSPRRLKAMLKDDGTARIHDTFRSFDWNGSGSIDRKELKEVLQELRLPCDGARVRARPAQDPQPRRGGGSNQRRDGVAPASQRLGVRRGARVRLQERAG